MFTFRAMGTSVTVSAPRLAEPDEAAAAEAVQRLFGAVEQRFSRFLGTSELSRLNAAMSETIAVSAELLDALRRAKRWHQATGGVFDPSVGAALCGLGYDAPFAPGVLDREGHATNLLAPPWASFDTPARPEDFGAAPPPGPRRPTRPDDFGFVEVDDAASMVTRPLGLVLDLGGLLKGRTVDVAAALLPEHAALDAGGDAVFRGDGPEGDGWWVEVEDPSDARRPVCAVRVRDAAIATSAANRRRWRVGSETNHHLVDPRTGQSAVSDLLQVSVVAGSAEQADVLAKCVYILGRARGRALLAAFAGVAAVLVHQSGAVEVVGALEVRRG